MFNDNENAKSFRYFKLHKQAIVQHVFILTINITYLLSF